MDTSETTVDVSGSVVDPSGTSMYTITPPKPDILSLDDLLNDQSVILQKEDQDKNAILAISNMTTSQVRPMLLQWATQGFPGLFEIYRLNVTPPSACSDGVIRNLPEYIEFCSGKQLHEHVNEFQKKLTNIQVGFANYGSYISIVVSKV